MVYTSGTSAITIADGVSAAYATTDATATTNATTNGLRIRNVAASGISEQANHVACAG